MFKVRSLEDFTATNTPTGVVGPDTLLSDIAAPDIVFLSSTRYLTANGERWRFIRERNIEKTASARHRRPVMVP